ncbi:MAG TPA: riboflavin synthase [Chroococcidiopsis sp.]
MFTGLIQTVGTLQPIGDSDLEISYDRETAAWIFQDIALGDSIAVDGVCLTVTQILTSGFIAAASPETLGRTTLGKQSGKSVNLETSLRVGSKLGGHFVTGHIDGTGRLEAALPTAESWEMSFTVPDPRVARYIVPKGSIAVNGISLTVAECSPSGDWFKAAVIPLTYAETNLRYLQPGSSVNLEGDVLGKYVEKFLRLGPAPAPDHAAESLPLGNLSDLSPAFLAEHGYL